METTSFSCAKTREARTQRVICRNLPSDRAELALRETQFFCEKFALRHRVPGPLERLGDALEGGEVALARHEHIFSPCLPAGEREERAAQRVETLACPGRNVDAPALLVLLGPRSVAGEIDLVEYRNGLEFSREPLDDGDIGGGDPFTRVHHQQHRVRPLDRLPGARHAGCLYLVVSVSPHSQRSPHRAAASVAASIRSATPSACARSSLSFRKARRVNSPGSARRAPSSTHRLKIICSTTGPPWPCSSSTSSPV